MSHNYSVDYSFTLTLKPKRLFQQEPEKQYDNTMYHVVNMLNSLNAKYTLIIELTKSFNIHYHGIISFLLQDNEFDCMKSFYSLFRKDEKIGYIYLKQITDFPGWIEYLRKDLYKTFMCVGRRIIIQDNYNVFTKEEIAKYSVGW